jgi:hypothetical protein
MSTVVTLDDVQSDVKSRLEASEYFADVPILLENDEKIFTKIEQYLNGSLTKAGKCGACLVLMNPNETVESAEVAQPFSKVIVDVVVYENRKLSLDATVGVGRTAAAIVKDAQRLLHQYQSDAVLNLLADPTGIQPDIPLPDIGTHAWSAKLWSYSQDNDDREKVADPQILTNAEADPTITLTCTTGEAAIYYTLDGTYPSTLNTAATLYAAPFVISSACRIKTCAYKTGLFQSNLRFADIP